jgi:RHS repeat-associated protein
MGCRKLTYHQEPAISASWDFFTSGKEKTAGTSILCIDYYAFGMQMPGRNGSTGAYRYGFQGQEKDDEVKGEGNSVNYKYRMHDPRVGRFFAVDPLAPKYPEWAPYAFSGNQVIHTSELEGLEPNDNLLKESNMGNSYEAFDRETDVYSSWEVGSWVDSQGNSGLYWHNNGETTPMSANGERLNLPNNAVNIQIYGEGEGVKSLAVKSFEVNGKTYGDNYENGKFNGYWDARGAKYSGELNSDGSYAGDGWSEYMQRRVDISTIEKSTGYISFAYDDMYTEAGKRAAKLGTDLNKAGKLLKKGMKGPLVIEPSDIYKMHDWLLWRKIRATLVDQGPGSFTTVRAGVLEQMLQPNYGRQPSYFVEVLFKGWYYPSEIGALDKKVAIFEIEGTIRYWNMAKH